MGDQQGWMAGAGGQPAIMEKNAQTHMWAQNQYIIDSGIHSGANTGAPSMMSGTSSLHDDLVNYSGAEAYTPGGYMPEHIQDMNDQYNNTRSQRIRAAMFPETLDEGGSGGGGAGGEAGGAASAPYDIGQSSNVARLAEGSQLMKSAVVGLINYQDDADLATKAIPELIRLMADEDQAVVGNAVKLIYQLSKKEAALRAMVECPELVAALVRTMEKSNDPATIKDATGTLYQMSQHEQGLLAIFRSGGIRALVQLLSSPIDSVVFYAITTLHNLLLHQEGSKDVVRQEGGVQKMVANLDRPVEKFLAILTDCLKILSFKNPDSKIRILQSNGPAKLVNVMRQYRYEKLLWTTSRVLKVLSVDPQNKVSIVQAGGLQALEMHLNHGSQRLVTSCLLTLRNLSDAGTKEENVEGLLDMLLNLLGSSDTEVVAYCVGILSNLSCNNQRNKAYLCHKGGVQSLLRILHMYMNNADISEPALCTLRHLTIRHPNCESAQNEVRHHKGLPLITHFLKLNRLPLMKAALGLIKNLVNNPANRGPLREAEAVQLTVTALQNAFMEFHQAQIDRRDPGVFEGVSVVEIIEAAALALQNLAKEDPANRQLIRTMSIVPVLINLLAIDQDNITRGVSGLLSELSTDKEGAMMIEREGAVPPLTELLHSRNDQTRTYVAHALYNINRERGGTEQYSGRLDQEISAALARDDSAPWSQDGMSEMPSMGEEGFHDIMYQQGTYDPTMSMDQMQLGSPHNHQNNNSNNNNDTSGGQTNGGYTNTPRQAAPSTLPPPPASQTNNPPGWYDTDL